MEKGASPNSCHSFLNSVEDTHNIIIATLAPVITIDFSVFRTRFRSPKAMYNGIFNI